MVSTKVFLDNTWGCPFGPYCFAAALQTALERVRAAFPADVLVAALHDRVELAGEPECVQRALEMLVAEAAAVGLVPAGHKFTLYVPAAEMVGTAAVDACGEKVIIGARRRDPRTPAAIVSRGKKEHRREWKARL